ncbi:MAG: biotin transporter BioY [Chloroflexota bacterium]
MLRTFPQTRDNSLGLRLATIAVFALLTVLSARLSIEIGTAAPITLQTFVIMLAGLVLGSRDGALSQVAYLALLAMNLPVDARGLGMAAFAGPTAGFLIGFPLLAYTAGLFAERGGDRLWIRWLGGIAGTAVLYLFGAAWLQLTTGMDASAVWVNAVAPFIVIDSVKAIAAALLAESGRAALNYRLGG